MAEKKKDIWAQIEAYNAKYGNDDVKTAELRPPPKKKKKKVASNGLIGAGKKALQGRAKSIDDRIKTALGKKK